MMTTDGLTKRQQAIYDFLRGYAAQHGYPPVIREICDHFSISLNAVRSHLLALQKRKYITRGSSPREIHFVQPLNPAPGYLERTVPITLVDEDALVDAVRSYAPAVTVTVRPPTVAVPTSTLVLSDAAPSVLDETLGYAKGVQHGFHMRGV